MLEPLRMAGIPVAHYSVDDGLYISEDVSLGVDEWLLYVNYFGVCGDLVDRLLERYPRNQIVIDNSQAFFSPPRDCLATIYSPRKFFGVPDGGYLLTNLAVSTPNEVDEESVVRCTHLLKRLAFGPEAGYPDYQAAEQSLAGQQPKKMSELTQRLLSTVDYDAVRVRRRENFSFLDSRLRNLNQFTFNSGEGDVPMCYPFQSAGSLMRSQLIKKRIFVPTYWPEDAVINEANELPLSQRIIARQLLPLPCDHRYTNHMLVKVVDELCKAVD
jgi:hypothetical protein